MNRDIAKIQLITAAGIEIRNRDNPTGEIDVKNLCLAIGHKRSLQGAYPAQPAALAHRSEPFKRRVFRWLWSSLSQHTKRSQLTLRLAGLIHQMTANTFGSSSGAITHMQLADDRLHMATRS